MSASSIKAGEAFIVISAKMDQLRADLNKGKAELKSWGSSLSSVGGAAAAGFATAAAAVTAAVGFVSHAIKEFADTGSHFHDMAIRTGLAADSLQHLGFAAKMTGASLDDVERAAKHMAQHGLSVSEFEAIGQSIAAIEDPTQRASAAIDTFGRNGTKLIPMFQEFKTLKAASLALGPSITAEEIALADRLGDAFTVIAEQMKRTTLGAGAIFGPEVITGAEIVVGAMQHIANTMRTIAMLKGPANFMIPLVQAATVLGAPLTELQAIGHSVLDASVSTARWGEELDEVAHASGRAAAALGDSLAIAKSIEQAEKRRASLVNEFATPHERYLQKQKEIFDAIAEVNRNRVTGTIGQDQATVETRALQIALARLRAAEQERIQGGLKKLEVALPQIAQVFRSSTRGTFSSAGAGLLGRGGEANAVEQKQLQELVGIRKAVEKFQGPEFQ